MANNLLVRYKIRTSRGQGIVAGNYINVYWDDVAFNFKVYKYTDATDTVGVLMSSGPDLGADRIDFEKVDGIVRPPVGGSTDPAGTVYGSRYRYCDGTTLVSFTPISLYPYSKKVDNPSHFSCTASTVCDLRRLILHLITSASDLVTADGAVQAFFTSSNGPIKYSLDPNFDYASGQSSALFENLYAGPYTIWAKDALGCTAQFSFTIPVSSSYGVLYRLDYKDVHGNDSRVDILQRGYSGSITEVVGSEDPFVYRCDSGDNTYKFYPIAASEGTLTLMSTSNFMFRSLHTQDDRKYQMKYYKDYGAGLELKFFGYLIPQNQREPYIKDPYPVTFTATDGLADLKNFDFADKDGNLFKDDITAIDAIATILAKTDLGINIQSAINRFQTETVRDATTDPFPLCKFSPDTFYHGGTIMNCLDALKEILKPFGGIVKQRLGKWFIYNPEQLVESTPYREFTSAGVYASNSTVEDIVDINTATMAQRAVMAGGGQMLEFIPAYGNFYLTHTLLKHESLVKGYGFELDDIATDPSTGLTLFNDWNVNISNVGGSTFGIKKTKTLQGDYNFYLQFPTSLVNNVSDGVSLLSKPFTIEYDAEDAFEYNFSYAALLSPGNYGEVYWIKLKWMFKVGSYYYNENSGWTSDPGQKYNEIIIDRFNDKLEKSVSGLFRTVSTLTEETAQVEFILTNTYTYDFADINDLKATATTTKPLGTRMKVRSTSTLMHYYILEEGTDVESLFDVVRPNDYAVSTNERIWVAEHISVASRGRILEYWYLDNVILLHNPDATEPPSTVTVLRKNNTGIKIDFEESYLLNDIDTTNINNSERTYKNFFKKLDGTPTEEWLRTYREGEGKLLDLLSDDIVSQYKTPSMKITGSFLIDTEILPTTILNEANDNDRKYMFMGYALHDKHQTIDFDIIELKDVTDPDSEDIDAAFTTGFSLGYRS